MQYAPPQPWRRWCRAALLAALLLPACAPEARVRPTERPFLWRIEAATPSFLYGTFHVPDPRVTALPDAVRAALRDCDVLHTEIRLDEVARVPASMFLDAGTTLQDVLPAATYARLTAYVGGQAAALQSVRRMKVWAVTFAVLQLEIAKVAGTGAALDKVLWDDARAMGKELDALESVDEQLGLFESFTDAEQAEMLDGLLDLLDEQDRTGRHFLEEMIEVYLEGDGGRLLEQSRRYSGLGGNRELEDKFMRLLLAERNQRMAERIAARLRDRPGASHFFAVGALHLVAESGLIALLQARGHRLTRLP